MNILGHRVFEKNLLVQSPYNTYVHAGLPPGPISQPDSASLVAALYPANSPYLYFVAQPFEAFQAGMGRGHAESFLRQIRPVARHQRRVRIGQ